MYLALQMTMAVLLVAVVLAEPARAAPADAQVGDGTPLSCTESALEGAVVVATDFIRGNLRRTRVVLPANLLQKVKKIPQRVIVFSARIGLASSE
jgi:hypothetical protein